MPAMPYIRLAVFFSIWYFFSPLLSGIIGTGSSIFLNGNSYDLDCVAGIKLVKYMYCTVPTEWTTLNMQCFF